MRRHYLLALMIGVAGGLSAGLWPARANLEVSGTVVIHERTDFETPLGAQGTWVAVGSYGRCWHPRGVVATWRPYCDGTWEWTDAGWYWDSTEPWAWACYHYGTWVFDPAQGWCWVPDVDWAPAWVTWRTSDDYIGWVPCGPPGFVVEPAQYVFVQCSRFHDRVQPGAVIINNTTIINRTTEIRTMNRENREINGRSQTVVVNEGPKLEVVEKATGKKFTPTPIVQADRRTFNSIPKDVRQRAATAPKDLPAHQPAPERVIPPVQREVPAAPQPNEMPHPDKVVPEKPAPASTQSSHWWQYHPKQPKAAPQPRPAPQPERVAPVQPTQIPQPMHPDNQPAPAPGGNADHSHDRDRDH